MRPFLRAITSRLPRRPTAARRDASGCNRGQPAPCTVGETPQSEAVDGRARLLDGAARRRARGLLWPTGPLFWSWLLYRLRGHTMNLYEVAPWGEPR